MARGPDKRSGGRRGGAAVAALLLGAGVVAAVWFMVRGRRQAFRRSPNPMRIGPAKISPDPQRQSHLRESILGQDKAMVQSVFGPPRAAAGMETVPDAGRQAYWEADTWYYPLDPKRRLAMAIKFESGIARGVDFVEGHSL